MAIFYGSAYKDYIRNRDDKEALLEVKKKKAREEAKEFFGKEMGEVIIESIAKCGKDWKNKTINHAEFSKKYPVLVRLLTVTRKDKYNSTRAFFRIFSTFEEAYDECMKDLKGKYFDFNSREARIFVDTNLDDIDMEDAYQSTEIKATSYVHLTKSLLFIEEVEYQIQPCMFIIDSDSKVIGLNDCEWGYKVHEF